MRYLNSVNYSEVELVCVLSAPATSFFTRKMMSCRGADAKNRCINCWYMIPKNQCKHSLEEASTPVINMLQNWITPTQLSPDSVICTECLALLQDRASTTSEESLPLPAFGHKKLCFCCGNSILRAKRTYLVTQERPERKILVRHLPLHLVSRIERVCAACWRSATREVQRHNLRESNRPTIVDPDPIGGHNIPIPPPLLQQNTPAATVQSTPTITSSVYRRAANTANHCIFIDCVRTERLMIPSSIKDLLLLNFKFYVPPSARICRHHLDQGCWTELTSEIRDFTGKQFDNIMSMMQRAANSQLDFSNVSIMPAHLCQFWLGMNPDQFYNMLNSNPSLVEQVPNASVALSIYLVKLRTGDSNERLATLFNISRRTLERLLDKARECLSRKKEIKNKS